jgi:hypothetical protein
MPNSDCNPLADAVASLSAAEKAKRDELATLTDVSKWKAMQELGSIRQELSAQQTLLDECEKSHVDDFNMEIVLFDVPGNSNGNRIARLWQLTSNGPALKQTAIVQSGIATFRNFPGQTRQSFGISIEEIDHPTVCGPDFRSGPLPPLPLTTMQDSISRAEVVILDPIFINQDSLTEAVPPLPIQLSPSLGPAGTATISVTQLQFAVDNTTVSVSAGGTISAIGMTSPFTFSGGLHISPSFSMSPSEIFTIATANPPVLVMPGIVGAMVQGVSGFISSNLLAATLQPLNGLLNKLIVRGVATALGLRSLPSGVVLSVRQLSADAGEITIEPALAAFGKVLSSFQPSAPDNVVRIASLELQPTVISTSDPSSRIAQGQVMLTAPPSSGGVSVMLSVDHPEIAQISPTSLAIGEGITTAAFTVTGNAQSLMPADQVDVIVAASLGQQTTVKPICVKREPPVTPVPSQTLTAASAFVTPETMQLEQQIFQIMNQLRTATLKPAWLIDAVNADEARSHSVDMASGKVPFGTEGFLERSARIGAATGHPASLEIPATGFQTAADVAQALVTAKGPTGSPWISGPGAGTRLGVGAARSQSGTHFFTAIFS